MTQHTKGPWQAVNHGPSTPPKEPWMTQATWYTVRDSRNVHIVTVEPFDGLVKDDVAANARLIAAAPDLLAELRRCQQWLAKLAADHDGDAIALRAMKQHSRNAAVIARAGTAN